MRYISRFKFLCANVALLSSFAAHAVEPPKEPILRIETNAHISDIFAAIATDKTGRWLVTTSADKTARIWDSVDGSLFKTLRIPILKGENRGLIGWAAISPDGQLVAVDGGVGFDNDDTSSVFLFDRASGKLLRRLKGFASEISSITFSPDGQSLALGSKQDFRLLSVVNGKLLAKEERRIQE